MSENQSEERYVDPNSGAAPQPGGVASGAPVEAPKADKPAKPAKPKEEAPKEQSDKGKARKA